MIPLIQRKAWDGLVESVGQDFYVVKIFSAERDAIFAVDAELDRLRAELAAIRSGNEQAVGDHPNCPICNCRKLHRAESGWYCPECELTAIRERAGDDRLGQLLWLYDAPKADPDAWLKFTPRLKYPYIMQARAVAAYLLEGK